MRIFVMRMTSQRSLLNVDVHDAFLQTDMVWEVIRIVLLHSLFVAPQFVRGNDDLFAMVKFSIPPIHSNSDAEAYLDWVMTIELKFSR
jgi:hypothetical protein